MLHKVEDKSVTFYVFLVEFGWLPLNVAPQDDRFT